MSVDHIMAALSAFSKICQKSFLLADIFQVYKYQILAVINVPPTRKKQQGSGKFRICKVLIVMAVLSIFNKIWKKSVVFTSERDISCYIFENIGRTKLILTHKKIHDIITCRWQYYLTLKLYSNRLN